MLPFDDALAAKFCKRETYVLDLKFLQPGPVFARKTTPRTKTTLGGRGRERPSERRTSALAARMNGIKGETPLQLHYPPLPLVTGTQGEPRTCHVTRRARCTLVAQNCDLNDLGHIPPH